MVWLSRKMEYEYSFTIWADSHWNFPKGMLEVFEIVMGHRIEFVWTEEHFEKVRSELSHYGFVMHEITRRGVAKEEIIL